jgi:hypothetical protein
MIARESTWAEVRLGMYVRDAQGTVYRVEGRYPGANETEFTLTMAGGAWSDVTTPLSDPVTIMEPTHDEAIAVAHRGLGATILREEH